MENSKPPRFFLQRQTLGTLEVISDVLDGLTIGGTSGAGLSAWADKPWLSFVLIIGTVGLQLLKRGLASTISRAVVTNPINTTEHTTVSTPDPIVPPTTDEPVAAPANTIISAIVLLLLFSTSSFAQVYPYIVGQDNGNVEIVTGKNLKFRLRAEKDSLITEYSMNDGKTWVGTKANQMYQVDMYQHRSQYIDSIPLMHVDTTSSITVRDVIKADEWPPFDYFEYERQAARMHQMQQNYLDRRKKADTVNSSSFSGGYSFPSGLSHEHPRWLNANGQPIAIYEGNSAKWYDLHHEQMKRQEAKSGYVRYGDVIKHAAERYGSDAPVTLTRKQYNDILERLRKLEATKHP